MMNVETLKQKLDQLGIRRDFYTLSGGLSNEAFCINEINTGGWEVYYSERGSKSGRNVFTTETDACNYFFDFITSDKVVMNNLEK